MTRLVWDKVTERDYEAGLDRGVFYPLNGPGHAWNGLTSVEESPSGGDARPRYLDGQKIADMRRNGEFLATVSAFTYPVVSGDALSTSKRPSRFSMSYRVQTETSYKLHLVYNALAAPSQRNYAYESTDPLSWSITTRGLSGPDNIVVSHLILESDTAYPETMAALEAVLYGDDWNVPRIPMPDEVFQIFEDNSILQVIDNGDGTFTVTGPDEAIQMLDATTFQISWPTAVYIDVVSYTIQSL
jgi:hypothetical protein